MLTLTCVRVALAEPVPDTCRIHYPSDAGIPWSCHRIGRRDTLTGLFGSLWPDVLRFDRIDRRHIYPGVRIKIPKDLRQVEHFSPMPKRFAAALDDPKFILVNLAEQFLGAYAHGRLVMSFPITSGNDSIAERRTPDGLFRVTAYDRLHLLALLFAQGRRSLSHALRLEISHYPAMGRRVDPWARRAGLRRIPRMHRTL